MRFVDTKILLYAVSTAPVEQSKSHAALLALEDDDLAISIQVLQEFYVQSTRGSKHDRLTHRQAAIVEAAGEIGCHAILSEDLNHGQDYDGVKVVNSFRKMRSRR